MKGIVILLLLAVGGGGYYLHSQEETSDSVLKKLKAMTSPEESPIVSNTASGSSFRDSFNKCIDAKGAATYSNKECPPGSRTETVEVKTVLVSSADVQTRAGTAPAPAAQAPRNTGSPQGKPLTACRDAKRAFEAKAGHAFSKSGPSDPSREDVYKSCGLSN